MKESGGPQGLKLSGVGIIAAAFGAVAVGAFAVGALSIGRLAVRRIVVDGAKFKSLQIEDLTVTRLHAKEIVGHAESGTFPLLSEEGGPRPQ